MINRKEHLTLEGLQQVVNIKVSMNLGLSDKLKEVFPNIRPVSRPLVTKYPEALDLNWFAGFASAESCFFVRIFKHTTKIR